MKTLRSVCAIGAVALSVAIAATAFAAESGAQAVDHTAITGAWTLNPDLSDPPPAPADAGNRASGEGRRGRGMGGGRGGGRGAGMGGGMDRGGMRSGNGGGGMSPEDAARMRDAMHDIMTAPAHLTITQTETMVLVTSDEGRTTRLAPDGSKIKDESTHIERKTSWDDARLVSEISGLGPGKITETYAVDGEHHQLRVTVQTEGGHGRQPMTMNRVYDADPR